MKILRYLLTYIFLTLSSLAAAYASDKVGVVLLHGIGTQPHFSENSTLASD